MSIGRDRVLKTHDGRLPRSKEKADFVYAQESGQPSDPGELKATLASAVPDGTEIASERLWS